MKDFLFKDYIEELDDLGNEDWITVYKSFEVENVERINLITALVSEDYSGEMISSPGWGIDLTCFKSGFVFCADETEKYFRFGVDVPLEPLVLQRFYNNIYPTSYELSEEFRLFHNLYFDTKTDSYISVNINSDENDVVQFTQEWVRIKRKYLKEFLSAKKMNLVIFFDVFRFADNLAEFHVHVNEEFEFNSESCNYVLNFQKHKFNKTAPNYNSRLLGKKIITGLKSFKPKTDYEIVNDREYLEFIIAENEEGHLINYSCNPLKLECDVRTNIINFFSPVFFEKQVLAKYYSNTEKYIVGDAALSCKGSWYLNIDNDHDKFIIVYLGDLGRNLSYKEQLYWKSFNVIPEGSISETKFKRDFLTKHSLPKSPDLVFKRNFTIFQDKWFDYFGYFLFIPLNFEDELYYKAIRVPLNNTQYEFENLILALSKVLCDSINDTHLIELYPQIKNAAGKINRLDEFLKIIKLENFTNINCLRDLQKIRSLAVAHRKGEDYKKMFTTMRFSERSYSEIFSEILNNTSELLLKLIQNIKKSEK